MLESRVAMATRLAADLVVLIHALFVLFVVFGWMLVLRRPRLAWLHVPAAVWGALIEFRGWICPLTPLEISLRRAAGEMGYEGGFIEHYVLRALYPEGLERTVQIGLGVAVVIINVAAYGWILRRSRLISRRVEAGGARPARW
jgi:hypothetical protein